MHASCILLYGMAFGKKGLFSTLDVMSVEQKGKEKGETSVIVKIIGGGIHEHYCLA